MIYLKLICMMLLLWMNNVKADLNLFPDDINYETSQLIGGLNLFPSENECPEHPRCDQQPVQEINIHELCEDHCTLKFEELKKETNQNRCYNSDRSTDIKKNKSDSTVDIITPKKTTTSLNSEGLLFFYRQFVHNFLEEVNFKKHTDEQATHFHISILLTQYQLNKLNHFATSQDTVKASSNIQEVTDILINMYNHVEYFKPEEFAESISKVVLSIAMDPRIQIALCLSIFFVVLTSWLLRQIFRHGFSVRSLVVTLLALVFVISVVNNHFLLTQKNQIFKNQKLKEKIPEECFGSNMPTENKEKSTNIFSSTLSQIKSYFKHKPTSQVCLEFQEALLLDSKQANFVETIVFTFTEAVRPISVLFGESINLFYSSLTKNLSFYQYMPLMGVVTVIAVPLIIYVISLLSLVFFGYEFNFFHLISFKKNNSSKSNEELNTQTEMLKVLAILKKENEALASSMLQSRIDFESMRNTITYKDVKSITTNMKEMTISGSSEMGEGVESQVKCAIEDSVYTEVKKPESYYSNEDEEIPESEKSLTKATETSVNESVCEEVVKYVSNSSNKTKKLMEKNELLQYENQKLKEMIFYKKANESITECHDLDDKQDYGKENRGVLANNTGYSNQISIGLSKSVKRANNFSCLRSLKNSYVKDISDNDFGDDDEDILVILDEK